MTSILVDNVRIVQIISPSFVSKLIESKPNETAVVDTINSSTDVKATAVVETVNVVVKPTTTAATVVVDACIICETENCTNLLPSCLHRVCEDCVSAQCRVAIVDEKEYQIKCPARKCRADIAYDIVKRCVTDESLISKLDALICAAALETELRNTKDGVRCVTCKTLCEQNTANHTYFCIVCDCTFCAKCNELEHSNDSDCAATQIEEALASCDFTSCPQCRFYLERIDGCDCVRCPQCKRKFCWRCKVFDRDIVDFDEHRLTCENFSAFNENEQSDREDD